MTHPNNPYKALAFSISGIKNPIANATPAVRLGLALFVGQPEPLGRLGHILFNAFTQVI